MKLLIILLLVISIGGCRGKDGNECFDHAFKEAVIANMKMRDCMIVGDKDSINFYDGMRTAYRELMEYQFPSKKINKK